ncbi:alginate lyase family protein [Sinomicrobium soli]|uniref:alginate lyase family protein n=1 Tax=Sinomicrobium sp. N-1-3-6 TaxID=2219864 RepID=UPI000DCD460B|nr:alginate lyase family protein [Sinomicrobium sp. N-1-3-6]RAV31017.1 hypothetical protein DN748_01865 [Sinomicrobium sp. N-1-3-6]
MNRLIFSFISVFITAVTAVGPGTGNDLPPGGSAMHPEDQIDYVKRQLREKNEPYTTAFGQLKQKADAAFGISHHAIEDFSVPGFYQDKENHRRLSLGLQVDAISAYSCALVWKFTGKRKYADKALYFLNAWASVNKTYSEMDGSLVMSYSGTALLFAANLLKDYKNWKPEARQQFAVWTREVFRDAANSIRFRNNNSGDWSRFASLLANVYLGDRADFAENVRLIKSDLFDKIAPDGHMTEEVKREKNGIWYTYFSLAPLTASMWVIYNHTGENQFYLEKDGASVKKALDYLLYYNQNPGQWKYFKDPVTGSLQSRYGFWPANLLEAMSGVYNNPAYSGYTTSHRPLIYAEHDYAWVFPTLMPVSLKGYE